MKEFFKYVAAITVGTLLAACIIFYRDFTVTTPSAKAVSDKVITVEHIFNECMKDEDCKVMAHAGWEMVDTDNLRPHYAKTLWAWSDALEAQLDEALAILAQKGEPAQAAKTLRAYRLYLAGCATGFEHGWVALHQMLAVMPDGSMTTGSMPGAQSHYPFTRDYMYR